MDCYQYAQQTDLLVNVRPRNSRQSVLRTIKLMEHAVPIQSLERQAAEECEQWFGRQMSEHSHDYKHMLEFVVAEHYAFKMAIFESFQEPERSFVVSPAIEECSSRVSSIVSIPDDQHQRYTVPQYFDYKIPLKEIDTNVKIPHRRRTMAVTKKLDELPLDTMKSTKFKKRRRPLSMQELFSSDEDEEDKKKKSKSPRYSSAVSNHQRASSSNVGCGSSSSSSRNHSSTRYSFMNPTKSSIARSSRK